MIGMEPTITPTDEREDLSNGVAGQPTPASCRCRCAELAAVHS